MLRAGLTIALTLFGVSAALTAEPIAPNEIKATFFTGQPFTAVSPSGAKFKMVFTADGRMTREPLEQSGKGSATGTWKLNAKGFCTAWNHAKPNCFTLVPSGENKWSVQKIATTIATTVADRLQKAAACQTDGVAKTVMNSASDNSQIRP